MSYSVRGSGRYRILAGLSVYNHGEVPPAPPDAAQDNLATVLATPGPSRVRTALEGQIGALLEARPDLLADVLAVLKRETGDHIAQTMTLADNNRGAVQNTGSNVTVNVSS